MPKVAIETEHFPPDSSEIISRRILLGAEPLMLLEPLDVKDEEDEDEPFFKVTTSLATLHELRPLLVILLDAIDANPED